MTCALAPSGLNKKRQMNKNPKISFGDLSAACLSVPTDYREYLKKTLRPQGAWGNDVSDKRIYNDSKSQGMNGLLHLGYLIQNHQTHPFALSLQDLTNLLVIGSRAEDIYYNLLIQLCDDQRIPVLVIKGETSGDYEDQVCESPLWHLDLTTDALTFDLLGLGQGTHPSRQITILIGLFEEFLPLSPSARNLLHVIIWKILLSTAKPTLHYLKTTLAYYQHHQDAYLEVRRLLEALPSELIDSSFDNFSLSRIHHLPTIITGDEMPIPKTKMNILLLNLMAQHTDYLPPLFLVNPPPLNPQLFRWLCVRYANTNSPLVLFDTQNTITELQTHLTFNYILTHTPKTQKTTLYQQLSIDEQLILEHNSDHVAVRLRNEAITQIINIF
jgi:hypothetical protein